MQVTIVNKRYRFDSGILVSNIKKAALRAVVFVLLFSVVVSLYFTVKTTLLQNHNGHLVKKTVSVNANKASIQIPKATPRKRAVKHAKSAPLSAQFAIVQSRTGLDSEIVRTILTEVKKYKHVTAPIVLAVIRHESAYNPSALNVNKNRSVDLGLMQINNKYALAKWNAVYPNKKFQLYKVFDPIVNVKLGCWYLDQVLKAYKDDYHKAFTAYNRGATGLKRYQAKYGTAVSKYSTSVVKKIQFWEQLL